jgi:hypothetical protein
MSAIFAKKKGSSSGQVTANLADVITAIGWATRGVTIGLVVIILASAAILAAAFSLTC